MKLLSGFAALAVVAVACGNGEGSREETVADDLQGLEEAFNEGDVERIYEDFIALDCRGSSRWRRPRTASRRRLQEPSLK